MHSSMRRARRLQTVDIDELSDYKLGVASMADNIAPKRRGRPPKPRPRKKPSTSSFCGRRPGSRPRGRPRKNTQRLMSDQQIATRLNWVVRRSTSGKRVGDASRTVLRLSGQWPWGVEILENLRKLLRIAHLVKEDLQECATKRSVRHPHLKNSDVIDACDYFSIDNYRSEAVQTTTSRTRIRRVTTLLSSGEDDGEDHNGDEDYEGHSDGEIDSHEVSARDEWEDWGDYDGFTEDEETAMGGMVATGKRSRSSSVLSRAPKRACTSDADAAGNDTNAVVSPDALPSSTKESRSHPDSTRPQSLIDLIPTPESLQLARQKELDAATRSLQDITASIQANESSALQESTSNKIIDTLCSDMKRYETEREKILKGRRFVQDHHEDKALGSEDMAKTMRQYEVRLDECNQLIAQANADVLEELGQVAQKEIDLKAEERRLCVHHQKAIEEVTHCQTIGTLMRLGSSGMTTLLLQLEERNVNLVDLAEAIMAESVVAAREQHSPTNDFP
ncbi:hypothetical protein BKA59DRAFT_500215 [Fusarium tricinctum]|uniref:Uncharacterized protein n=1 Tax=Fusarium tricinctum TaxID=61284 RepID=A0A8K0WD07_9HYPO|nr:hypothetical protein BKA59DRAFT_500215 [Fusarium tricinctum]